MLLLNKLCDVIIGVDDDVFLFMGGYSNCTAEASLDENYLEPHPAYSAGLKHLIEIHNLKDVWRGFNGRTKQFTLVHCRDNTMSLARLNRFYCFKHHFKSCQIIQVGLSDHSLVLCCFYLKR